MLYLTIVIAANKHELLHRTNLFVFWQVTSFYSLFVAIKHRCFIRLIWFIEIRAIAPSSRASEWCMHVIAVNASELNLLDFLRHFHKVKFITMFKYSNRFRASPNKNCSLWFCYYWNQDKNKRHQDCVLCHSYFAVLSKVIFHGNYIHHIKDVWN